MLGQLSCPLARILRFTAAKTVWLLADLTVAPQQYTYLEQQLHVFYGQLLLCLACQLVQPWHGTLILSQRHQAMNPGQPGL